MTAETAVGLQQTFWENFPLTADTNEHVRTGLSNLLICTEALGAFESDVAIEQVGVEYTRLFIGPGKPAAPPWETLYREGGTVLFGQPTFEMKQLFAHEGVKVGADSHQFEDHLGFELLYLGMRGTNFIDTPPAIESIVELRDFIKHHPLSFIKPLLIKVREAVSIGYYSALIELIWGLLLWDFDLLDEYVGQCSVNYS
ncbi:MAG: molecular chaperone TorD family protein [Coriobacteriales bacterium]|nr:molecular chaperone TorD family protein [Coriobacteriales bacterium]